MTLRAVYTDLDGTLLGRGASLFRDGEGNFTLLPARALEACHRAGLEVVIKSGRRRAQVKEDARLLGQTSYIFEVGSGMVIDGEETFLTGELQPRDGKTIHAQVEESGAPALLLERNRGRLEPHAPWHRDREVSHLFRGLVDVDGVNAALAEDGHGGLRLVDNGTIPPHETQLDLPGPPHAYHLIPAAASKAGAVMAHMRARGYAREQCLGVGDSREDLGVSRCVGRFFLVANALEKDPELHSEAAAMANVEVTEASHGEGFYEAVVRWLAESRV
ncbi:MAG TPA: HAD hydrolase family protein [Thermoleophilaceae bacterium]|nr:HAD hydrolase family protein [Thermoleophilaceae bacterium]